MPDTRTGKELEEARQAVIAALDDLAAEEVEILEASRSHTTAARYREADHWGVLGATLKRLAEAEFLLYKQRQPQALRGARAAYERGLKPGGFFDHWILGQFVVLRSVLNALEDGPPLAPDQRWYDVCRAVQQGIDSDEQARMWALSSRVDLRLVAQREGWEIPFVGGGLGGPPKTTDVAVVDDLELMIRLGGGPEQCPALWPTFRQFWRWRFWWTHSSWQEAADAGFDCLWKKVKPQLVRLESTRVTEPTRDTSEG
jgi:hypothetical protein